MLESQIRQTPGDTSWFVHDRFGMFIHWGLYSLAARHEWVQSHEQIDPVEYRRRYFNRFDPDLYDPHVWADMAQYAGMKYGVITTKHHEGFCLWDSSLTDYKATNTPAGRDLLRPFVEAFRTCGMRIGFYHSLIDWQHPDFWVDAMNHPLRNRLHPDMCVGQKSRADGSAYDGTDINSGRDQSRYIEYLHGQVRELLTGYGNIDVLWFDFSYPDPDQRSNLARGKGREAWNSEGLLTMIRSLMPRVLLTDRLDLDEPLSGGDFRTPEQSQPRGWVCIDGKPVVWEACQTFSGSWGYHRGQHDWRSVRQLLSTLIDCVSKGGNLLLNVGPTGRGDFDQCTLDRLRGIGRWMRHHGRSIYGCTQAPDTFKCPEGCKLTYNPTKKRLYIHILDWPYKSLHVEGPGYQQMVEYAQLLHDASEVAWVGFEWSGPSGAIEDVTAFRLPQSEPRGVEIPVIELFLK